MKLTFLGTVSATPTGRRNVSGMALQFDQASYWWLFDCGEGTQHQIIQTNFTLARLSRIFISHLHGDHCFGLMGLLASRGMQEGREPVVVYGPSGIEEYIRVTKKVTGMHLPYPLEVHEITSGIIYEDAMFAVRAVEVVHVGETYSFVVEEKKQPGRFQVEKAQAMGIPPGPIYGQLKSGKTVTLPDGKKLDGSEFVDPPREGRKLVLVMDTCNASAVVPYADGAQLLVHESTYLEREDVQLARRSGHSTAADAAKMATKIGTKALILNHFSQRYEGGKNKRIRISDLVQEAKDHFSGEIIAARDYLEVHFSAKGAITKNFKKSS